MSSDIKREKGGIYIHVPFCRKKCIYCDFYSGGLRIANWEAYVISVLNELQSRKADLSFTPYTLYLGGGTPSLMPNKNFRSLIKGIREICKKNDKGFDESWHEFTIEANPEDIDEEKCKVWKEEGVNRVSLGVQSFRNEELKSISRNHQKEKSIEAINIVKKFFDNVSIDLMFGLPNQNLESWNHSLEACLRFEPPHISAYSLMLEENTAITHLYDKGKISLPAEAESINMWQLLNKKLAEKGYIHYEISNFALPGKEGVHNTNYWRRKPYIGLGPSSHSYDGKNIRKWNPADIKSYLNHFSNGITKKIFYDFENLSTQELKEEFIMTSLRTARGIDLKEYEVKFGFKELSLLREKARSIIEIGKMLESPSWLTINENDWIASDPIIAELI